MVYVDDYEIGTTPVSRNFTYYGTRKIRLVKDGYETLTVMQPIPPPWYQIPPLDFVTEVLVPGELCDRRTLNYHLAPQRVVPTEQLLERAEDLRAHGQSSGVALWSAPPPAGYGWPASAAGPSGVPDLQPGGGVPVHPLPPGAPLPRSTP